MQNFGLTDKQKEDIGLSFVQAQLGCRSPYGKEKARQNAPFSAARQNKLEICFDNMEKVLVLYGKSAADMEDLCDLLAHFKNIRAIVDKCADTPLGQVELFELKGFLLTMERFLPLFIALKTDFEGIVFKPMTAALDILDPHSKRVAPFYIEDSATPALAVIRQEKAAAGQGKERAEIAAREDAEEMRIMAELSRRLRMHLPDFYANMDNLGQLDFAIAKAKLAQKFGAARPKIAKDRVVLENMLNPLVAHALAAKGKEFTKISINLKKASTIITGANMGGKSVAIKTAALNATLACLGFFVFADAAEVPLFDDICLLAEDLQNAADGLSSFGAEITHLNEILHKSKTQFMLILLDEPARTTNPAEGAAIARALVAHLAQSGCVCLISTHYDQVEGDKHYRVAGLAENVPQGASIGDYMDYTLIEIDTKTPPHSCHARQNGWIGVLLPFRFRNQQAKVEFWLSGDCWVQNMQNP